MINLIMRTALWVVTSLVMTGTMLAVALVNLPVLLFSLMFDRQRFYRLVQSCLSSYGSK